LSGADVAEQIKAGASLATITASLRHLRETFVAAHSSGK
jgi:hypothetical protein